MTTEILQRIERALEERFGTAIPVAADQPGTGDGDGGRRGIPLSTDRFRRAVGDHFRNSFQRARCTGRDRPGYSPVALAYGEARIGSGRV